MERILMPFLNTIGTRIYNPPEEVTAEDAGIYKGSRIYVSQDHLNSYLLILVKNKLLILGRYQSYLTACHLILLMTRIMWEIITVLDHLTYLDLQHQTLLLICYYATSSWEAHPLSLSADVISRPSEFLFYLETENRIKLFLSLLMMLLFYQYFLVRVEGVSNAVLFQGSKNMCPINK